MSKQNTITNIIDATRNEDWVAYKGNPFKYKIKFAKIVSGQLIPFEPTTLSEEEWSGITEDELVISIVDRVSGDVETGNQEEMQPWIDDIVIRRN